jgi:hypothetical protein
VLCVFRFGWSVNHFQSIRPAVIRCEPANFFRWNTEGGISHVERLENGFIKKNIQALAAGHFDHPAQHINPNPIGPVRSGVERQRDLRKLFSHLREIRGLHRFQTIVRFLESVGTGAVSQPGCVKHQITNDHGSHRSAKSIGSRHLEIGKAGDVF